MPNYYDDEIYEGQKKQCIDRDGGREWPCPACKLSHDGCHADWGQKGCSCGCQCSVISGKLLDELMNYNLCGP